MKYEEKQVLLKNGKTALFRAPRAEDGAEMLAFLKKACGETEYLSKDPEEIRFDAAGEAAYLKARLEDENSLMIVCEIEGKIAGNCQIVFGSKLKTRHRAAVMIALLEAYWGLGIGTKMMQALIEAGRARGVRQLELEMIEGNDRAERLYRSVGFEPVAEHPDAYLLRDGTFRKGVYFRKML